MNIPLKFLNLSTAKLHIQDVQCTQVNLYVTVVNYDDNQIGG